MLSRWRSKWSEFAYNYGWSRYVILFDGWIAKCAMAVPILGYLILFNDSISQHLSFNKLADESSIHFGLSSLVRLKIIYFGLIFLGSANILYRLRRPFTFKIGTNQFDYVEKGLEHFTVSAYININGEIQTRGHHTLHGKYYDADWDTFLDLALGKREALGRNESTANWLEAKNRYGELLRSMLIENFYRNNVTHRISLTLCLIFATAGYFLLFIPSIDLFIKVMIVVFR